MAQARELKGVYNLNPTKMVMKQGSKLERQAQGNGRSKTKQPVKAKGK